MQELRRKIKKITSILRVKKITQDTLAAQLNEKQREKERVGNELTACQGEYLTNINRLNQLRQSPQRLGIEYSERHVDALKDDWVALYKKRQEIQHSVVILANDLNILTRQIEIIEKAITRYQEQVLRELDKNEQSSNTDLYGTKIQRGSS
jgi:predicted nuclease with TOPRIM domain